MNHEVIIKASFQSPFARYRVTSSHSSFQIFKVAIQYGIGGSEQKKAGNKSINAIVFNHTRNLTKVTEIIHRIQLSLTWHPV